MVIPPDFGFLRGWLTTQHYEHEYPFFFCLIVSRFSLFFFLFPCAPICLLVVVVVQRSVEYILGGMACFVAKVV